VIAVVDYDMGNLHSVQFALDRAGGDVRVIRAPEELREAERIVLPGVGAFGECVRNLHASGLLEALTEEVMHKAKPFLGICLGMQVLASQGHEGGLHSGLNWVPGVVRRFDLAAQELKVPHVGWNEVRPCGSQPMFKGFRKPPAFYFVHSYHLVAEDVRHVAATCDYGGPFTAAVVSGNVFATQFHPEKSQHDGLRLLENFLDWMP
jgi:glutamine amidotransferase